MTGPVSPQDPIAGLAAELGELSHRLADVQGRLLALRAAGVSDTSAVPAGHGDAVTGGHGGPAAAGGAAGPPAPATGSPPPAGGGWPRPGGPAPAGYPQYPGQPGQPGGWPAGGWAPGATGQGRPPGQPQWGQPGAPAQFPQHPYGPPHPTPAAAPKPRREGLGPQLVAWTGGTITLLGIVLLLVLAANRGWLQPGARVIGGALLSLALIGVAAWVRRQPGGRTGAVALAATGVAGLYLDVIAATAGYEYLPVPAGLALAVVVAGGGLAIADLWRSQPLAVGALAGAGVLAPILTEDPTPLLVALVVVLQLVAVPVVLCQRWIVLASVAAAWPFLYGMSAMGYATDEGQYPQTTAALAAVLVVGVGLGVAGARRLPTGYCCVQVAAAPLPLLAMALGLDRTPGAFTAAVAAVLLLVVATPWMPVPREVRAVAMVVGGLAGFEATMIALRGGSQTAVLLSEAVALAAAAIVLKRRSALLAASLFGLVGLVLAVVRDAPLHALVTFPVRAYVVGGDGVTSALVTGAGVSALVLVFAVLVLVAAQRVGLLDDPTQAPPLWVIAAAVVLYGAASLFVTLALLVTPTRSGFLGGHVLITVSWTVAALVLLVRGIRVSALRVAGGALVIAAVAKLVLFDLSQLDGVARVLAFLGAGLVLLAAGTRYARLVAAAQPPDGPRQPDQPGPGQPGQYPQPGQAGQPQAQYPPSGHPPQHQQPGQQVQYAHSGQLAYYAQPGQQTYQGQPGPSQQAGESDRYAQPGPSSQAGATGHPAQDHTAQHQAEQPQPGQPAAGEQGTGQQPEQPGPDAGQRG